MNRVHRVFYFAVAVAFASALVAPGTVTAGPGNCPAYSAADIDDCFVIWEANTLFDPLTDFLTCQDDPATAEVNLLAETVEGRIFFDVVVREDIINQRFNAELSGLARFGVVCGRADVDLSLPGRHICRAEILRSFTWRQLCAQRVDRSP